MTQVSGKAASPMDAASGDAPQEARLLHECDQHCDHGGQTLAALAFLAMPVAAVVLVIVMALR